MIKELNEKKEHISSTISGVDWALIDFWAPWCQPCRAIAPIVEEVSNEDPNTHFYKVNTDETEIAAVEFNITSLPTLVITRNGREVARHVGTISKSKLKEFIAKAKRDNY